MRLENCYPGQVDVSLLGLGGGGGGPEDLGGGAHQHHTLFFHCSQLMLGYATTEDEEPFDNDDPEEAWEFDEARDG